jgi:ribosomal protein L29
MQAVLPVVPPAAPSNLLLAALKEELFQLEVERQQGKLEPGEYEKARAAVEQTLQRALNRKSS